MAFTEVEETCILKPINHARSLARSTFFLLALGAGRELAALGEATVYRDENDLPHIVATTEEAAWFALGYEEARDALFHIRINLKIWTGHSAEFVSAAPHYVYSDFLVQMIGADKSEVPIGHVQELLSLGGGGPDRYQLFENLEAYAAGINAYIVDYASGPSDPVREWIEDNYEWMLEPDVDVREVASYGAAEKARQTAFFASAGDPFHDDVVATFTNACSPPAPLPLGTPSAAPDPAWLEELRSLHPDGALGSNAFQWTHGYTYDQGTYWAGSVSDPHLPRSFYIDDEQAQPPPTIGDHAWFAHIKVEPTPGVVTFDSLGWMLHGSGVFGAGHNRDVATAGSLGAPNISNTVLLRVRDAGAGQPPEYYSYYRDTDKDDGQDPGDWVDFTEREVTVLLPSGCGSKTVEVYETEEGDGGGRSFGFVFYTPGESLSAVAESLCTGSNATGQAFVRAHRLPVDPRVDAIAGWNNRPDNHHARLAVGAYEAMRATSVVDVMESAMAHDSGLLLDHQSLDRNGDIFGLHLGTIPRRGVKAALVAAPWQANTKSMAGVLQQPFQSAFFTCDRDWDWIWKTSPQGMKPDYLQLTPICAEGSGNPRFWPYVYYSLAGFAQPLRVPATAGNPFAFENPGFVVLNNDFLSNAWKKRTAPWEAPNPLYFDCSGSSTSWVGASVPDNALLDQMLEAGTFYHQAAHSNEANQRNQTVIDALTPIYQTILGVQPGAPTLPMTIAEAKTLAMDNRWYAAEDYPESEFASFPVPVRQLAELHEDYVDGGPDSLKERFAEEAQFFSDLWQKLFDTTAPWSFTLSSGTVLLRDVWVNGVQDPFIVVGGQEITVPMPDDAALIDFHPQDTFGWVQGTSGLLEAFTGDELTELGVLMQLLEDWDTTTPPDYRNHPDSKAAALLSIYQLGLANGFYRWTGLVNGQVHTGTNELELCPTELEPLVNGMMPATPSLSYLQIYQGANGLSFGEKALAPLDTLSSVLEDPWGPEINLMPTPKGRYFDVPIPTQALYDGSGQVKAQPSAADVNALVFFFLELGGFYDPTMPSAAFEATGRHAKFNAWNVLPCNQTITPFTQTRGGVYRTGYPFTRATGQAQLLRRLLETGQYLKDQVGDPTFGEIYRIRVRDLTGAVVWPPPQVNEPNPWIATTQPCTGGFLRSVSTKLLDKDPVEGWASQILCLGGSSTPLVTFFPYQQPGTLPQSFYWNVPGQNVMGGGLTTLANHMVKYRDNVLLSTHFHDFPTAQGPSDTHTY